MAISICFITFLAVPAYAFETAAPMDFIFKGGDYSETSAIIMEDSYSGTIPGPNGASIHFKYSAGCELKQTGTNEGIEIYTAPLSSASASGTHGVPAHGYTMGLLHEPMTSSLAWFVDDINGTGQQRLWTRELADAEYAFVGFEVTMATKKGTNAFLVQYAGLSSERDSIILKITDADAPKSFTSHMIKKAQLPGYFDISGGGILQIEKVEIEDSLPILYYQWAKEPLITPAR